MTRRAHIQPHMVTRAGSVLILVVWVITLLSVLAAGLGSRGAWTLSIGRRLTTQLQESYVALAAVQKAAYLLATDPTPSYDGVNDQWANSQSAFEQQRVGEDGEWTIAYVDDLLGAARYGLIDEERKLNLTTVPEAVFQRLLEQVGRMKDRDAHTVAQALVDWRDADKQPQPEGAEDFYYTGLAQAYECKDGPVENVQELLLLKGMTLEAYEAIVPYVTVYGSGAVNLNTTSEPVLWALGLSQEGIQGFQAYRIGEDNVAHSGDERALASVSAITSELSGFLPQEDLNRLAAFADFLTVESRAFRFLVDARTLEAAYPLRVEGVMSRTGQILAWMER